MRSRRMEDGGVRRGLVVVTAMLMLAAACGGSEQAEPTEETTATPIAEASPTAQADATPPAPTEATATPADGSTQSDAPAAPPSSVMLLDPGDEPRAELGISAPGSGTIRVTVQEASIGTVGDEPVDERESAEFLVDVVVTPGADGSSATLVPTIVSLDVNTPAPTDRQIGPLEWTLDGNGQLIEAVGPDLTGTPVVAAANLLAVPELFAIVPTEAVGVGAQWQYSLASGALFTVRLTGISDEAIDLAVEFTSSDDDATVVATTVGSYDRASLLATDVDAQLRTEFRAQTTRSGEVIDIDGTFELSRRYVMEPPS